MQPLKKKCGGATRRIIGAPLPAGWLPCGARKRPKGETGSPAPAKETQIGERAATTPHTGKPRWPALRQPSPKLGRPSPNTVLRSAAAPHVVAESRARERRSLDEPCFRRAAGPRAAASSVGPSRSSCSCSSCSCRCSSSSPSWTGEPSAASVMPWRLLAFESARVEAPTKAACLC
ncbi:hypothetical protein ISCGN_017221 [Ixodes scapularis]